MARRRQAPARVCLSEQPEPGRLVAEEQRPVHEVQLAVVELVVGLDRRPVLPGRALRAGCSPRLRRAACQDTVSGRVVRRFARVMLIVAIGMAIVSLVVAAVAYAWGRRYIEPEVPPEPEPLVGELVPAGELHRFECPPQRRAQMLLGAQYRPQYLELLVGESHDPHRCPFVDCEEARRGRRRKSGAATVAKSD